MDSVILLRATSLRVGGSSLMTDPPNNVAWPWSGTGIETM